MLRYPRPLFQSSGLLSYQARLPYASPDTRQYLTSHLNTSLSIPIRPPNTTISKPLLLPNLGLLLHFLQALLPSPPSSLPMGRRNRNQNTLLFDIDFAQPMRHSNSHKTMLLTYGACNILQSPESQRRIRRVRKMRDCLAIERIASATYKKDLRL
jgi:hypothetical protein